MALTLVEAAKINSGDVVKSAVIEMFARESDVLMTLPFEGIQGNALKYNREASLPGVAFRGVNESFSESTGVLNPITEALTISGGDLDVDRFIIATQGEGVRATHEQMKVKALAAGWTAKFIKGDSATNPREFDGLQNRLTGAQVISAGSTAGGAALSLASLDELIDAVDNPTHLIMSKAMRRKITAAARTPAVSGYVTYDKDAFGRRVAQYNDLPILVAYGANGGDEILPFNEAAASGAATASSIYCVSMGDGRLTGIQNGDMDVRDLGELQSAPVFRTRVEWFSGIAMYHGRAAARLNNVGNLAIVA
ncbi:major capsid protein [Tardiphaga sp. 839_C3_N1_4]|uniref:major capsid protein n=1 Tax=Tardiphaga sp. 839_C3_N1_4 TaxID=3240761 RepID=UPI003F23C9C8